MPAPTASRRGSSTKAAAISRARPRGCSTTAGRSSWPATPPTYGLRYVSDDGGDDAPILVWSARGEEAWLHELAADRSEREIAHCTRLRSGGAPRRRTARPRRSITDRHLWPICRTAAAVQRRDIDSPLHFGALPPIWGARIWARSGSGGGDDESDEEPDGRGDRRALLCAAARHRRRAPRTMRSARPSSDFQLHAARADRHPARRRRPRRRSPSPPPRPPPVTAAPAPGRGRSPRRRAAAAAQPRAAPASAGGRRPAPPAAGAGRRPRRLARNRSPNRRPRRAPVAEQPGGGFPWLYAIPAAALALLGLVLLRRRRRRDEDRSAGGDAAAAPAAAAPAPAPPAEPRRGPGSS